MEVFKLFIIHNFILLFVSVFLYINSIIRYRQNRQVNFYIICITTIALVLAISNSLQAVCKANVNLYGALFFSIVGYVLRPTCLFILILMSGEAKRGKLFFLYYLPLIINAIVYLCAFIPGTKTIIFGFSVNENGMSFIGGPLRYTSHIIGFLYLLYLLYISISKLKGRHISHGLTVLSCAIFVITAVVIESFFSDDGEIDYLLNSTIVVGSLIYYLFLFSENSQYDVLTGLYNRGTYYHDIEKMNKNITGVIQFDLNGLKYINDNFGHEEGDKALKKIADIIFAHIKKKMYAYRLGGDEFLVLSIGCDEIEMLESINDIRSKIAKTKYHCSIGYAYREDMNTSIEEVSKIAEERMYEDKKEFYKTSPFERRKVQ